MKKIYLLLIGLCISAMGISQAPVTWWSYLPDDFLTNQPTRDEVKVVKIEDSFIENYATLEAMWGDVEFSYGIDALSNPSVNEWSTGEKVSVDVPTQDASDYTGTFAFFSSPTALYMLVNTVDDEVDFTTGDGFELVVAPNGEVYDPGRTIHANYTDAPAWQWDDATERYKFGGHMIHPDTMVMMANYGLWGEENACKMAITPSTTAPGEDLFLAQNLVFDDITGVDTIDITPGSGTLTVSAQSLVETSSTGYLYLLILPWDFFTNGAALVEPGDMMSLAVQGRDFDSDNFEYQSAADGTMSRHTYSYWGGADDNSTYWAPVFYGAQAELVIGTDVRNNQEVEFDVFYNESSLIVNESLRNLEIFSVTGARVRSLQNVNGSVDLSEMANGMYIATMKNLDGATATLKFVKY